MNFAQSRVITAGPKEVIGRLPRTTDEERAAINRLMVGGQLAAARCIERLILDGCLVTRVEISPAARPVVIIAPPPAKTGLWSAGAVFKSVWHGICRTDTWCVDRFGCRVEWVVSEVRA